MLQSDSLYPWLTVLENSLLGLEIEKKLTKENIKKVHELLDKYGLYDFKDKYPRSLSGGMKQRVGCIQYRQMLITLYIMLLENKDFENDFKDKIIKNLLVYDYSYSILNNE